MKYLVLMLVVAGVAWWMWGRRSKPPLQVPPAAKPSAAQNAAQKQRRNSRDGTPQAMLACAHCGVHLPESETTPDGQGRRYCSEAHRLAGPASH